MGYYLQDHPPASSQYRAPRREPLSGTVVVHTAEGGPAANVASFIARRSDPGSYHELTDPGGHIAMMPDEWEAFHVAADGHNRHSWGISAAWRAVDWNPDDPATVAMLDTMAARIRAFAERNGWNPAEARWVSRDEALAARGRRLPYIGLVCHGTLQPADRSDAWTRHPERARLDAMLLARVTGGTTTPPTKGTPPVSYDSLTLPTDHPTNPGGVGVEFCALGKGVLMRWQRRPDTGPDNWTDWEAAPLPPTPVVIDSITARVYDSGVMEVLVWPSADAGTRYRAWQNAPGGGWDGWLQV